VGRSLFTSRWFAPLIQKRGRANPFMGTTLRREETTAYAWVFTQHGPRIIIYGYPKTVCFQLALLSKDSAAIANRLFFWLD